MIEKRSEMVHKFHNMIKAILAVEIEGKNRDDLRSQLEIKTREYNVQWKFKGKNELLFEDNGITLLPVPFSSTSDKPKVAFFGINPMAKKDVCNEKDLAGKNLQSYAEFYNSKKVFEYVIDESKSGYYTEVLQILDGLYSGEIKKIEEIRLKYTGTKRRKKDSEIFFKLTKEYPSMFIEFIPFHSKSFGGLNQSKIDLALSKIEGFKEYIHELDNLFNDSISENGLIIVSGKAPASLFLMMYANELEIIEEYGVYGIYEWKGKQVIIAHNKILGKQGGALRTIEANNSMLKNLYPHIKK